MSAPASAEWQPGRAAMVLRWMAWAARSSPVGALGCAIVLFWVAVSIAAPYLAPFSPTATIRPMALPGTAGVDGRIFWLGTDHLGRDILSRIIWGARTVLTYAPLATACAYAVGILGGLVAGYRRGWIDECLSHRRTSKKCE